MLLTIVYSFISIPLLAIILVIFMGPLYQMRDIAQNTFVQHKVERDSLGKYLAARATFHQVVFSLSVFLIGLLVDLTNARFVYLFAGVLLLASALYGYIKLFKKGEKNVAA